jgi:hypothetical protein
MYERSIGIGPDAFDISTCQSSRRYPWHSDAAAVARFCELPGGVNAYSCFTVRKDRKEIYFFFFASNSSPSEVPAGFNAIEGSELILRRHLTSSQLRDSSCSVRRQPRHRPDCWSIWHTLMQGEGTWTGGRLIAALLPFAATRAALAARARPARDAWGGSTHRR